MKTVVYGNELKEKMLSAVTLLGETVGVTLGPSGLNVLINASEEVPFITNDGVTIAKNITSDDSVVNTILEIAKEASLKTNELVGDGTTTTIVLLKELFIKGLKEIENGKNPIILKQELEKSLQEVIGKIKKYSKIPTIENFKNIASISANDKNIGQMIGEIYTKVKNRGAIKILESPNERTYYEMIKGYSLNTGVSYEYFTNKEEIINLSDPNILLYKDDLDALENISDIVNDTIETQKTLVIIAPSFKKEVKEECLSLYFQKICSIFLVEIPEYSYRIFEIEKDLEYFLKSKIADKHTENLLDYMTKINQIELSREQTIFYNESDSEERVNKIQKEIELCTSDYQKEYLEERLAKLSNGICNLYIGGITETEKKEKIMRVEDALWAVETAKKGIVPGEGLILAEIKYKSEDNILYSILDSPIKKILKNVGLKETEILNQIIKNDFKYIYNIEKKELETIEETKILDATDVVITSLQNAVSIATMLLTTSHLIINETSLSQNIEI